MKPEIKKKWVEALRSGEYKQTRGVLLEGVGTYDCEDAEAFCCLGVLYTVNPPEDRRLNPYEALKDMGLDNDSQDTFMDLNDTERWTFPQIADYIEENL